MYICYTLILVPLSAPVNLSASAVNDTAIHINWEQVTLFPLSNQHLMWQPIQLPEEVNLQGGTIQIQPSITSYILVGLEEYITYNVSISFQSNDLISSVITALVTTMQSGM